MKSLFLFLSILLVSGCNSLTYTQQIEDSSYIQFQGNYNNAVINLGEQEFVIDETVTSYDLNGTQVVKFEAPKGKSLLIVSKNNSTVIKKYVFLNEGQTLEVTIP